MFCLASVPGFSKENPPLPQVRLDSLVVFFSHLRVFWMYNFTPQIKRHHAALNATTTASKYLEEQLRFTYAPNKTPPRWAAWSNNFQRKSNPATSTLTMAKSPWEGKWTQYHMMFTCDREKQSMKRRWKGDCYLLTEPAEKVKNGRNTKVSLKSGRSMATYDRTANNAPD